MSEIRPMVEVVEYSANDWRVYFNFDPTERCTCEVGGLGCGHVVYHYKQREKAEAFAKEIMRPEIHLKVVEHWQGECGCDDLYSLDCKHYQLIEKLNE